MAWLPSSCNPVHRCLWIPGLREGDDSPLRTSFRRAAPATCPSRQLPTPRILPCGLDGTSQIRLPPCAEGSSSLSLGVYHAARVAAELQPGNAPVKICNAVVLDCWHPTGVWPLSNAACLRLSGTKSSAQEFARSMDPIARRCHMMTRRIAILDFLAISSIFGG